MPLSNPLCHLVILENLESLTKESFSNPTAAVALLNGKMQMPTLDSTNVTTSENGIEIWMQPVSTVT